MELANCRWTVL